MNRYFRRLRQFGKDYSARRSQGKLRDTSEKVIAAGTPQDVTDPRAKGERHGKVTADKWNQ
jgi:hypothetical protein